MTPPSFYRLSTNPQMTISVKQLNGDSGTIIGSPAKCLQMAYVSFGQTAFLMT